MNAHNNLVTAEKPALAGIIEEVHSKGALVPVELTSPSQGDNLTPVRPKWMKPEDESQAKAMVQALLDEVKAAPADVRLLLKAQTLGQEGDRLMVQPLALYEKKVTVVLSDNQEGSKVNQTLLQLKIQMDLINPSVLKSQSVSRRVLGYALPLLSRMPKGDEVIQMIYQNRETVMTTVRGLVEQLRLDADNIEANVEDLASIYRGLLDGQKLVERDIYIGQLVIESLKSYIDSMQEGPERDNVSQFAADMTTQVISLMGEENLNLQFFAGAQAVAKISTGQLHNIRNLSRLLQRSVLASLGLNVAAKELQRSMHLTQQLGQAIGNTVRDTASGLKKAGDDMARMRAQGSLDLQALEDSCGMLEQFFEAQATANQVVIEQGGKTMRQIGDMSSRLRRRVEGGHESMVAGGSQ